MTRSSLTSNQVKGSSNSIKTNSSPNSSNAALYTQKLTPLDYDLIIKQHSQEISQDSLKDIILIPSDVCVIEQTREFRRAKKEIIPTTCLPYMYDLFSLYTHNWQVLENKSANLSGYSMNSVDFTLHSAEYEHHVTDNSKDGEKDKPDPVNMEFIDLRKEPPTSALLEQSNKINIIALAQSISCYELPVERNKLFEFKDPFQRRIRVDCIGIKVEGAIEPYFASLAIYDIQNRRKVSEHFYFHLNDKQTLSLIAHHIKENDPVCNSKSAVFSVTYPSTELYFVLRLDKVLEANDVGSTFDRNATMKARTYDEYKVNVCKRLGAYRQPVAWTAFPVFEHEHLRVNYGADGSEFIQSYMYRLDDEKVGDDEVISAVINRKNNVKKMKTVPIKVHLRVTEIDKLETVENTFDSSHQPLLPAVADPASVPVTREIQEFPQSPTFTCYTTYFNNVYVYPLLANLNKANTKARNVTCRVQLVKVTNGKMEALSCIYGKFPSGKFVSEVMTPITYHNRTPAFYEEVKAALPLNCDNSLYFLFSFYHIKCKDGEGEQETLVGQSCMPVATAEGRIVADAEYHLPIALNLDPSDLSETNPNVKWLENKKPLFLCRVKVASSVYPKDDKIAAFFHACSKEGASDDVIGKAILGLKDASPEELVYFCPSIIDKLFYCLCQGASEGIQRNAFKALTSVVSVIHHQTLTLKKPSAIIAYVNYRLANHNGWKNHIFQQIVKQWKQSFGSKQDQNDWQKYAFFYFDCIVKSGLEFVQNGETLDESFIEELKDFGSLVSNEIYKKRQNVSNIGKALNESFAYFLIDCFAFISKKIVFDLIAVHVETLNAENAENLYEMKFDFLRIVCGYEHFVAVNLPLASFYREAFDRPSTAIKEHQQRHFLIGTLSDAVISALHNKSESVRTKAIQTLFFVLLRLSLDTRYAAKEVQRRICGMFLPFVAKACDVWGKVHSEHSHVEFGAEKRLFLLCFVYIVQNMGELILLKWLRRDSIGRFILFVTILEESVRSFEFQLRLKSDASSVAMQQYRQSSVNAKRMLEAMYKDRPANGSLGVGFSKTQYATLRAKRLSINNAVKEKEATEAVEFPQNFEELLSQEVALAVLCQWETLVQDARVHQDAVRHQQELKRLLTLLASVGTTYQSRKVTYVLFYSLRRCIYLFGPLIYQRDVSFTSEISAALIKHSCSPLTRIRSISAALFYLLLKKNFEVTNQKNISKIRIQVMICLSKLELTEDYFLCKTLATLRQYFIRDSRNISDRSFIGNMNALVDVLLAIIEDNVNMNHHRDDAELLVDMYHRISQRYKTTPELRVSTINALLNLHLNNSNHLEAAMCCIHIAVSVSEYLEAMNSAKNLIHPKFLYDIIPYVKDRPIPKDELTEDAFQSENFSELGLHRYILTAADLFKKAHFYELAVKIMKLALPFYETNNNFEQLATMHGDLRDMYKEIVGAETSRKRILGTYFRVRFYGQKFQSENGKEYIYREKKLTHITEFCDRLKTLYARKYGDGLELVMDSAPVDPSKLTPASLFLQITHVEPYLTPEETTKRASVFERMCNIDRFVFEIPFTPSGKAHGSVAEQHMKQIVLKTEAPFPFVKRRLEVVKQFEVILTPLDVAIQGMEKQCQRLKTVVEATPPNAKGLQMVLQGSVRVSVNAGPFEIANTFLQNQDTSLDVEKVEVLRFKFKELLILCSKALEMNRDLIKEDQVAYQVDLENGFDELVQKLSSFVGYKSEEGPVETLAVMNFLTVKGFGAGGSFGDMDKFLQ